MSEAVLTDITLSLMMMVAFYGFYLWTVERRDLYLYVFGVAAALAVLTKGPVAIVILLPATVIYLLLLREFTLLRRYLIHPWVLLFGVVCAPWYADILARDVFRRIHRPRQHRPHLSPRAPAWSRSASFERMRATRLICRKSAGGGSPVLPDEH